MKRDPVVVNGTLGIFAVATLPQVPADRDEVMRQAATSTRRIPDAMRSEAIDGLRELEQRLAKDPNDLGDLGPDGKECGALADEMEATDASIARCEAVLDYLKARRMSVDDRAARMLDGAHKVVELRMEHNRLSPESYVHVRRFVDARGAAISQGMSRAQRTRDAVRAASSPSNDTRDANKTGTG